LWLLRLLRRRILNSPLRSSTIDKIEEAKTLDLPTITTVVIDELQKRIEAGMHHRLPVPFYYEVRKAFQREEL